MTTAGTPSPIPTESHAGSTHRLGGVANPAGNQESNRLKEPLRCCLIAPVWSELAMHPDRRQAIAACLVLAVCAPSRQKSGAVRSVYTRPSPGPWRYDRLGSLGRGRHGSPVRRRGSVCHSSDHHRLAPRLGPLAESRRRLRSSRRRPLAVPGRPMEPRSSAMAAGPKRGASRRPSLTISLAAAAIGRPAPGSGGAGGWSGKLATPSTGFTSPRPLARSVMSDGTVEGSSSAGSLAPG